MIEYSYSLDITPGGSPTIVYVSQYDTAFTINFELYSRQGVLNLESGTTAQIRGTKLDGVGYSADATYNNYTVTVTGDAQMTAIAGDNHYEIVLLKNDKKLCTSNFILRCERAALDKDTIGSASKLREFADISDRIDEIVDAAYVVDNAANNLETILDDVRTAANQATRAASNAANDVQTALSSDIARVLDARTYIENYVEGLVYGDEVSY